MDGIFWKSLFQWQSSLSVDRVIMLIIAMFILIGAIDLALGNKHGYGSAFTDGLDSMGSLVRAVAAVYAAAPLFARVLTPLAAPLFSKFGANACTAAGIILSSDMGGYALAMEMSESPALGIFSGIILGGTVGSIWVFTLPVALSLLTEKDRPFFASGILCGLVAIPVGCIVGGFFMGMTDFPLPMHTILINTLPIMGLALLVCAGLWFKTDITIRIFNEFGKCVTFIAVALTGIAIFEQLTGILFPFFDTMVETNEAGYTGFEEGLLLCGNIAIVLAGAFPMMLFVRKHGSPLLRRIENLLNINSAASLGLLTSCANCIPTFASMKDMDNRGKILNAAFAAGGGFAFGDYLGFAAGAEPEMIMPMLAAKLTSGILGVILALLLAPILLKRIAGDKS